MASNQKRSNLWVCIIYPDSMPEKSEINRILLTNPVPVLISPLHNKDLNANKEEKKPHYHMMIDYGSGANKNMQQVKELTDQFNGTIPIICSNRNAMIRYFIHYDNPDKHQYKIEDLRLYNGFELGTAFESYSSDNKIYDRLENLIYENMIYNYALLIKYLRDNDFNDELNFIRRHSTHINFILNGYFQLISSNRESLLHSVKK